jgi:predicted nucleic acid-binding protein
MVVVDTNILAYLLIDGEQTNAARKLFQRDAEWKSEEFLLIEFSNVLATYERRGNLSQTLADKLLSEAAAVMSHLVTVPHKDVLDGARRYGVSAYDARFLILAERERTNLITEDSRLRAAAPTITCSLDESLGL